MGYSFVSEAAMEKGNTLHSGRGRTGKWWTLALSITFGVAVMFAVNAVHAESKSGQTFKDWRLQCDVPPEGSEERCFMVQNLVMREGGQRLLNVAVGYLAETETPAIIFTLPLGVSLPPGVSLQVDEGETKKFPVERCTENGCIAGLALDDASLATFKEGIKANVTFSDGARRPVTVPVSLKGFSAGFTAVRRTR